MKTELLQLFFEGHPELENYKQHADGYICSNHPDSPYHQVTITPGGMVHLRDGANSQYVTGTALLFSVYGDLLARHNQVVRCGEKIITCSQVLDFATKQVVRMCFFCQAYTALIF